WWDRPRLEQVVVNLVDNAIKYGQGRPIDIRLETRDGHAVLTVRDQGIGIAAESLPRLFGRFERAVSERHYGGLGLGLYITRTLVEAMGGTVRVESQLGQGAVFTVDLPLRAEQPAGLPAPS
ncbi:MAG: ATP-binding protein, partial [Myxococcaceae bacterium]